MENINMEDKDYKFWKIQNTINKVTGIPKEKIKKQSRLSQDLGLDEVDIAEVQLALDLPDPSKAFEIANDFAKMTKAAQVFEKLSSKVSPMANSISGIVKKIRSNQNVIAKGGPPIVGEVTRTFSSAEKAKIIKNNISKGFVWNEKVQRWMTPREQRLFAKPGKRFKPNVVKSSNTYDLRRFIEQRKKTI